MSSAPVLIVEDDELVRSFLCRALTGLAGPVDSCATGAEALDWVRRRVFGAILIDGLLPDTHGIELAKRLVTEANAAASGICFVSGSLRRSFPLLHGVSALPKPLRLRELHETVQVLLDWHDGGSATTEQRRASLDQLGAELLVT